MVAAVSDAGQFSEHLDVFHRLPCVQVFRSSRFCQRRKRPGVVAPRRVVTVG